jgi:hypothetical protein
MAAPSDTNFGSKGALVVLSQKVAVDSF